MPEQEVDAEQRQHEVHQQHTRVGQRADHDHLAELVGHPNAEELVRPECGGRSHDGGEHGGRNDAVPQRLIQLADRADEDALDCGVHQHGTGVDHPAGRHDHDGHEARDRADDHACHQESGRHEHEGQSGNADDGAERDRRLGDHVVDGHHATGLNRLLRRVLTGLLVALLRELLAGLLVAVGLLEPALGGLLLRCESVRPRKYGVGAAHSVSRPPCGFHIHSRERVKRLKASAP
ncbi:protein of unknown function [Micropruina glycogenica]|uniref:Uncharacterized protein n=1 Tax=Micropruina glycogenica TaxID=75385 RepID=A0A2N9JMY9_9ACTN|nr:protein of unknown function [Micropruina glycogenica]